MTDYNRITDYATKDGLPSGSTLKIVRGTEIHNEFNAIETAVNSKANINSPTFTGTVVNATNGQLQISLTAAQTAAISPGKYFYDVEIFTSGDAVVTRLIQGSVVVTPEVTR